MLLTVVPYQQFLPATILESRYSMTLWPMLQLNCVFELSVTHNFYVIRLLEIVSSSKIVLTYILFILKIGDKKLAIFLEELDIKGQ